MAMKEGKVYAVSSNGGVIFAGEKVWYNPVAGLKTIPNKEDKGKTIILNLTDSNKFYYDSFTYLQLGETKPSVQPQQHIDRKDVLISRQVAIKAAAEIAHSADDVLGLAEQYEKWILRP